MPPKRVLVSNKKTKVGGFLRGGSHAEKQTQNKTPQSPTHSHPQRYLLLLAFHILELQKVQPTMKIEQKPSIKQIKTKKQTTTSSRQTATGVNP